MRIAKQGVVLCHKIAFEPVVPLVCSGLSPVVCFCFFFTVSVIFFLQPVRPLSQLEGSRRADSGGVPGLRLDLRLRFCHRLSCELGSAFGTGYCC
jgi:hypothetical protein